MSAAPATLECPECGKAAERQLHGGAGLLFKGSGFYLTDYGKNAHRGKEPAKSNGKSDTKSDSKAAAKPDSPPKSEAPKSETKSAAKPKPE